MTFGQRPRSCYDLHVNRPALVVTSIGIGFLAGAIVTYTLMRPRPEAPETAATADVPPAAPAREAPPPKPAAATPAPRAPAARAAPSATQTEATAPVVAGRPTTEARPEFGTLRIDSDVPGARVFIDREYIGVTPVIASSVTPGTHRLNISADGYDGLAESVEVEPGSRDIVFMLREVRLDAKLDVVHKHRLGSCKGQLVATPQGMRYETTDKGDAFNAALLDLDAFEVDYLEKNLRLKLKKGKLFNFTDLEGNADRLFVFHRDVDKARERLKKGDPPANP